MRVVDLIKSTDKTAFSFEILPPLKGTGIEKLYKTVDTLREFDPKYINITTHRSEYVYKDLGNGLYQRARMRRRPGTVAVAAALQNKYKSYAADLPARIRNMYCWTYSSWALPTCWYYAVTKPNTNPHLSPKETDTAMHWNWKDKLMISIRDYSSMVLPSR